MADPNCECCGGKGIRAAENDALERAALKADEEKQVFARAVQRYVEGAQKLLQSGDLDGYHRAHNAADEIKERIMTVCDEIAKNIRALKHKDVE
jgi:hypothetical protein